MTPSTIFVCDKPWGRFVSDVVLRASVYADHRSLSRKPRQTIYFPHYSKIVEPAFLRKHRCIGFHIGDTRGGSPLQWERLDGKTDTLITMFRMTSKLDAGEALGIAEVCIAGTAEEAYIRAIKKTAMMALWYEAKLLAKPNGESAFALARAPVRPRRGASDSELKCTGLNSAANFIQMLDAEGYPHAFFERDGLRFEFTRAVRRVDSVVADVKITAVKTVGT